MKTNISISTYVCKYIYFYVYMSLFVFTCLLFVQYKCIVKINLAM